MMYPTYTVGRIIKEEHGWGSFGYKTSAYLLTIAGASLTLQLLHQRNSVLTSVAQIAFISSLVLALGGIIVRFVKDATSKFTQLIPNIRI